MLLSWDARARTSATLANATAAGLDGTGMLAVLPALTTAVSDAAAAAGAWPVRVVEHRPSLNPEHRGHLSVLDIRSDAFDELKNPADGSETQVYRQLVLGVWEVGAQR